MFSAADNQTKEHVQIARLTLELCIDAVIWFRKDGGIEYANATACRCLGYEIDELTKLNISDIDPGLAIENWPEFWESISTSPRTFETNYLTKDGKLIPVEVASNTIVSGGFEFQCSFIRDISQRKRLEQREFLRNHILEMLAKGAPLHETLEVIVTMVEQENPLMICSILIMDKDGKRLLLGAAQSLPGFYNEAINGVEIGPCVGSCGAAAFTGEKVIVEDIQSHPNWVNFKELAARANLRACWSEPIKSSTGKVLGVFGVYHNAVFKPGDHDIEGVQNLANLCSIALEFHNAQEELIIRANFDYLTGLANRRYFMEHAELALLRHARNARPMSLAMLDLDYFKNINDKYGHSVGDFVLQSFGKLCKQTLREIDILGRMGGEEFAFLLPETTELQAFNTFERLRKIIENSPVLLENAPPLKFTVSIGMACLVDKKGNISSLLNRADNALYQAKQSGRNRLCVG